MSEDKSWDSLVSGVEDLSVSGVTDGQTVRPSFDLSSPEFVPSFIRASNEVAKNSSAYSSTGSDVAFGPQPQLVVPAFSGVVAASSATLSTLVNNGYSDVSARRNEEYEERKQKIMKEAQEIKETINIVFIGHVDAGKSTIGGHLLYLTGQVDKRTLEKYEREAREKNRETWFYSWALDINAEERDKGKTVEVGRAFFETPRRRFVLLDAPGHKGYVPNMISGAAQADVAVLVISARSGEFETGFDKGGQTREHALIAKISGIRHMIVVVNKMDDPTVQWCHLRFLDIEKRLQVYLKKIGWKANELFFMPISGFSGANLKETVRESLCNWWGGKPTFLEYLDTVLPEMNMDVTAAPMVVISDKYKDMGTVVIGKVIGGCFAKNDTFVLMPGQRSVKVSNIFSLDEEEKTLVKVGDNVKIRLSGVEEEEVCAGAVLCSVGNLCPVGMRFEAQLVVLECKSIMCPGFKAVIHIHNAVDEVTFLVLKRIMDRKTGEWSNATQRFIKQDSVCVAAFSLTSTLCIAPFSAIPYLGRFSLRDEGRTVAFGKVLKVIK